MRILLHTCCAPCLIYPLRLLREKDFEVTGFYYNPNIHPFAEYLRRKEALEILSRDLACEIFFADYDVRDFFRKIHMKEDAPQRCLSCWELRLKVTAAKAASSGYSHFSTTMLVSPYQDQEALKSIGGNVGREEGVDFYFEDFRSGFSLAHQEAKAKGIYCQKYCGCIYSEVERCSRSRKP